MPRLNENDANTSVSCASGADSSAFTYSCSCAARSTLVSITCACSRSAASSSRSSSIASTRARCWSVLGSPAAFDSGWRRRVSEKRRTSVSVCASRNKGRTATPRRISSCSWPGTCGSEVALRTSIAIATRRCAFFCSSSTNDSSSSGGRLSTQK
jgi:hypothetical protein